MGKQANVVKDTRNSYQERKNKQPLSKRGKIRNRSQSCKEPLPSAEKKNKQTAVIGGGKRWKSYLWCGWKTIGGEKFCKVMSGKLYRSRKKLIFVLVEMNL